MRGKRTSVGDPDIPVEQKREWKARLGDARLNSLRFNGDDNYA